MVEGCETSATNSGRRVRLGGSRVSRARWYRGAAGLAAAVLTGIGIALAAQTVGIHAARVASGSMSPAIDRGDWILVGNLDRNDTRTIRRGEIVVFSYPLGTTGRAIKRVVAIAGDTVRIGADAISVNRRAITAGFATGITMSRSSNRSLGRSRRRSRRPRRQVRRRRAGPDSPAGPESPSGLPAGLEGPSGLPAGLEGLAGPPAGLEAPAGPAGAVTAA